MWTCVMCCFPGSSVLVCWHGNFWSWCFCPEHCCLKHSFPTPHRFSPAGSCVEELTGCGFRLSQCHTFIGICSKHCPFFFLCSNQSVCLKVLNVQYKSDWNSGKLWECSKITWILLPAGWWPGVKVKVAPVCDGPLGMESCLSFTHYLFFLLHVLCKLKSPPSACSLALQKTWEKKMVFFFFCKVSELNWLTEASDECQG